jgi:hypothetical protein
MNNRDFMQYLRGLGDDGGHSVPVSRTYLNHQGVKELITLPASYWDYVDWIEECGDGDFAEWVIHCGNNPFSDWTISHLLMHWLWMDECGRHRHGLPTPTSRPPEGYVFATTPGNDVQNPPNHAT